MNADTIMQYVVFHDSVRLMAKIIPLPSETHLGTFGIVANSKAPVTPGLRPGYDEAATKTIWNRRQIVERTYGWSQRSWVIARGKSVATRSMVMFKTCNLRFQIVWYHE